MSFVIKNDTDTVYEEVQVRLRPNSGNVDFVLDGFTGKTTVDKRANLTVEFSFRAKGACGETLTATLDVKAKTSDGNGTVVFGGDKTFQLGRTTDTTYPFSGGAITINDRAQPDNDAHGKASPYPSTLTVANVPNQTGLTGERVSKVTVTLRNLTHGFSPDISAVLVSPWGQKVLLMRNAGNGAVGGIDVTLDSGASSSLPLNGPLFTGSFKPTDNEPGDANLPDVAGPYSTDLGSFNINAAQADQNGGQFRNPNGDWKLYVQDTQNGSSGTIGGWDLRITTSKIVCCGAGETFPTITTVIDGNPEPRIDEVVENEDALYVDNDPPPSQSPVDLRSPIKAFQVNDLETAAGSLTVTATSGNQNIIKDSNLRIKGSGVDRTIEFKPEANANGNVGITVRVTDGTSRSSTATFNLKVNSINDTPAVSEIRGVKVPRGTATAPISFTVGDVETQSDFLVPTVQSVSDTSVLGPGNVFFGGSGPNRTVQVFPANPGASGTQGAADITVRVSDLDGGFTDRSFRVDFSLAPGQPTITPLAASSTDEDTPKDIGFTVTSTVGTSAGSLQVTRTSSNQNLVPVGNITINGSGSDRTIHIVPAADRNSGLQRQPPGAGTTDITITVTDPGNGASSSTTFTFTVNPKNDAPTISVVADQTISEDSNTGELAFTVGDQETPASSLTVSADSSNTALVDAGGISLSGSGANRSIKVTPIANAFGRTTITVRVSDDGDNGDAPKSTTRNFVVTVNGVNDAPVITQAQQPGQTVVNLAGNDTDSPVVVTINEDLVDGGHPDGQFVDGDASKGVIEQTVSLLGITAGAGDEREQTVSLAASVDRSDIISSVRFDTSNGKTDDKVKSPNTGTTLIYRPARNASGTAIVTLVLTDNGVGGNGVNVLSTVRKFKIVVKAINDAPSFADVTKKTIPRRNPTAIPIDISDVETPKAFLKVTATSSDNSLIKDANIVVDPNRNFITVTPEDVVIGTPPPTTTITVRVEDLGATNSEDGNSDPAAQPKAISRSFVVEVANVLPPTVTLARDSDTINEDDLTGNTLIVGDNNPISDANMTVSVSSDNLVLVPATSIALGPFAVGTPPAGQANGATKQIIIDPADNQSGTANISIRVTDSEGLSVIRTYRLTVLPVEDAPSISVRTSTASDTKWTFPSGQPPVFNTKEDANPVRDEKTDSKLIEISVSDPETPNNITLSASSKVPTTTTDSPVIPPGNITIGGTGGTRTLTIVPAPNKNGTARITVTATDGAGLNSSAIFDVNVAAINDPPTMDAVSNITVDEDSGEFVVALKNIGPGPEEGGIQQVVDILVTEKNKGSDPATHTVIDLVNNGSDYADGSTTYNLRIRPKANASGTAEVSVKLTDNGANGGDDVNNRTFTFDFVVGDFNDAPTISFSPNSQLNNAEVTTAQGVPSQVVPFYINDAETSSTALQVSAVSSNPNLVPNTAANLQVGGSAANRGIIVVPAAGQFGIADITLTVRDSGRSDGTDAKSNSITLRVIVAASDNPSISAIPDQVIPLNGYSDIIFFTVNDAQTPPEALQVFAESSSNPSLVPLSGSFIQFGGVGSSRLLAIQVAQNQRGTSRIKIGVRDGDGKTSFTEFNVTVRGQAPTITSIPNQSIGTGQRTQPLPFTVDDHGETLPPLLVVTAKSSNPSVIPDQNVFILGSGANRTATVQAGNAGGTATITLTVTDSEQQTGTTSFTVTVADNNTDPTITSIAPSSTTRNKPTGPINFIVGDAETPASGLTVAATSGNTSVVANSGITVLTSPTNPASRSLVITPVNNQTGTALITVTVTDGGGRTKSTAFLLTVSAVILANDFNGDGSQDIVFQDNAGFVAAWFMSGDDVKSTSLFSPDNVNDTRWKGVAAGDFNGDGKADLLFQHTDGSLAVWLLNGVQVSSSVLLNPATSGSPDWKAVACGDFNKDGKVDILFQHTDTSLAIWYMDGINMTSVGRVAPGASGPGWAAVGTGDVNGDGNLDIVFQHTDSTLGVWYLTSGNSLLLPALLTPQDPGDVNWRAVSTLDLNGDGKIDILFQHRANNNLAIWYMNREKLVLGKLLNPANAGGTWHVVAP